MDPKRTFLPQNQVHPLQGQPQPPLGQACPPPYSEYPPQTATFTNATVVVAMQPMAASTTRVSTPAKDHSGIAICALIFSIFTLLCCGSSLICLAFSIPALILAIVALTTTGSSQRTNANISIGLNTVVVVCTVLFLVIFIPAYVVGAVLVTSASVSSRYCPAYYSRSYSTYCRAYSTYTASICNYYASPSFGYCPT